MSPSLTIPLSQWEEAHGLARRRAGRLYHASSLQYLQARVDELPCKQLMLQIQQSRMVSHDSATALQGPVTALPIKHEFDDDGALTVVFMIL